MEKKIKISAIQMCAEIGDKNKNIKKIFSMANDIEDTDIIVLPEVWDINWSCEAFKDSAEPLENSACLKALQELATEKNANIIGGSFITKNDKGEFFNTCPVINRKGDLVAIYNKNHLYSYFGSTESKQVSKGAGPVMVELEGVKYGLTICYDIRFPEIYRAYRKAGADIFINCAAWANTKPIPWEMMTKSRAIENQTYMVAVNQYGFMGNNKYNLGHSRIIDYNGNVLSEILDGEGVIQANIELDKMYDFRAKCTVLKDIRESYEVICKK